MMINWILWQYYYVGRYSIVLGILIMEGFALVFDMYHNSGREVFL